MSDEDKTKQELIEELQALRQRVSQLELDGRRIGRDLDEGSTIDSEQATDSNSLLEEVMSTAQVLRGEEPTETIDLSSLFNLDITDSGSFDIRSDIWETTFGKVIQALPIPALIVDQAFLVTVANEACGRISAQYQRALGLTFPSLFPSPSAAEKVRGLLERVFGDRKPRVVESTLQIADEKVWGRMTMRSVRIKTERFLLILLEDLTSEKKQQLLDRKHKEDLTKEITERKRSEEALRASERRFRHIFENAPLMMHSLDKNGVIRSVNAMWLRQTGYSENEVVGKTFEFILTKESQKTFATKIETLWAQSELYEVRDQYVKKDGTVIEVVIDSVIVDDPTYGRISLCISRDVTHELLLEKQLREAQKMEAVGTLAGGVAHDFNNLLQIILGYADLLALRTDKEASSYHGIRAVRDAAKRGSDLVKQLLTFSRRIETDLRPLDLNHEVQKASRLLSRTIPKMIAIELDLAEGLQAVYADANQVEQIVLNLAINAKDAMPERGTLTFRTENAILDEEYCRRWPEVKPGNYVSLIVTDTGHGMDKEVLEHIFEPFYTTKEPGEGTGLGLSIVFGIVKLHGGHITCQSRPGKGTVFEIFFPALEKESQREMDTTGEMPAFGTETILMVDDEALVRDWGEDLLTQAGYTVITARNGREALQLFAKYRAEIDLVILDLIMPEMGGKQCLEELIKVDPGARVLVASGFPIDKKTKTFLTSYSLAIVSKPFNVRDFLRVVRKALDD